MRMGPVQGNEAVSLDDLGLLIGRISDDMRAYEEVLAEQPAESLLPNLRVTVEGIGSSPPRRPPFLDRYMYQWKDFVSGKRRDLDRGTVRCLSWEPDIATSMQFLQYLQNFGSELTVRHLGGLVRSCHLKWEGSFPESPSVVTIGDLVNRYERPSPIIQKWKSNMDAILSKNGPAILSRILVTGKKNFRAFLEEWYLEPQSSFVQKIVETATAMCRDQLAQPSRSLLRLLFKDLLQWPDWKLRDFKQEVGALVLHGSACGQTREILQKFILLHRDLGDPRLPSNLKKWAEIPEKAKERVLQWLSTYPLCSLERVYREEKGWFWRRLGEGTSKFPEGSLPRSS
jgi:hypothetical protein